MVTDHHAGPFYCYVKEVFAIIKSAVDAVNERVPDFKKIRKFTVREEDFIRTTAKKIKRGANSLNTKVAEKKGAKRKNHSIKAHQKI